MHIGNLLLVVVVDVVMVLVYQKEMLYSMLQLDNQIVFDNQMLMNKVVYYYN